MTVEIKDMIIVGASGFGRELLQWIKDINNNKKKWNIKGFIDDNLQALDGFLCDYKVLGRIIDWQPRENEVFACGIADPKTKQKVTEILKAKGAVFERIIHPTATIGEFTEIGEGFVAYPNSCVTNNVKVGDFVTLLLYSSIGHDAVIGDYSTISSHCDITGGVKLGKRVFLGSHATIVPKRIIGDDAYIGAGSVVVTHIQDNKRVMGNPARKIEF